MKRPLFIRALAIPPALLSFLKEVAIGLAQEAIKQIIAHRNRKK